MESSAAVCASLAGDGDPPAVILAYSDAVLSFEAALYAVLPSHSTPVYLRYVALADAFKPITTSASERSLSLTNGPSIYSELRGDVIYADLSSPTFLVAPAAYCIPSSPKPGEAVSIRKATQTSELARPKKNHIHNLSKDCSKQLHSAIVVKKSTLHSCYVIIS